MKYLSRTYLAIWYYQRDHVNKRPMCYVDVGRDLGLKLTSSVERVPGGDYVTILHRKTDRGPFTWEDITPMTKYLQENNLTFFGDAFSYIQGSRKIDGEQVNYHKLMVKVFT